LPYGITQILACHPAEVNAPRLTPGQYTGRSSIYQPRKDGRLSWPRHTGVCGRYGLCLWPIWYRLWPMWPIWSWPISS